MSSCSHEVSHTITDSPDSARMFEEEDDLVSYLVAGVGVDGS